MYRRIFIIISLGFFITGCSSQMKVVRHEFEAKQDSKTGEEISKAVEIEYAVDMNTSEKSIYVLDIVRVTDNNANFEIEKLELSPDGTRIAYQEFFTPLKGNKNFNINTVHSTTGIGIVRIVTESSNDTDPTWTPDGKYIVYSSDRKGILDSKIGITKLWKIGAAGIGGVTQLTFGLSTDSNADVSRDGQKIVFSSIVQGASMPKIFTINIDGSEPTELCVGDMPKWSPDGKKIFFIRKTETETNKGKMIYSQIWSISSDGANPTQLTFMDGDSIGPVCSIDGNKIAFISNAGILEGIPVNWNIWIVNSDGTGIIQITTNYSCDRSPCWSSDGKYIYFYSNRGGKWDIWKLTLSPALLKPMLVQDSKKEEKIEEVVLPPVKLQAKAENGTITLLWENSSGSEVYGYNIYMRKKTGKFVKINDEVVNENKYTVDYLKDDVPFTFAVTSIGKLTSKESAFSENIEVTLKVVTVTTQKPAVPISVKASPSNESVVITWEKSQDTNVIGYNIYESRTSKKWYKKVNEDSVKETTYTDIYLKNGVAYYFVITSVDKSNTESDYSEEVSVIPVSPVPIAKTTTSSSTAKKKAITKKSTTTKPVTSGKK
ncbi:MAG: hypothetical protein AABY84_07550 [Candidatus Firestonebacteria bacterium]